MSRRTATLGVAGFLIVLLSALAALLPVPYVVLTPGPTADTLNSYKGKQLITISKRSTYPADGALMLTTVEAFGGPGSRLDLISALRGWIDSDDAVVPVETVYPRGSTAEEVEKQSAEEMELSQEYATAAALRSLDIDVTALVRVQSVSQDAPALGVLKANDVIVSVKGSPVRRPDDLRTAISSHPSGEPVAVTVRREGRTLSLNVPTGKAEDGRTIVGIMPAVGYEFPFPVTIELDRVGGPSAGLMFALGIIDKLTAGAMTGGTKIAGTGTIDGEGNVGPIGGVAQKMRGARKAGATVFLAPAANCAAAARSIPEGLRVVKVTKLADARTSVERIAAGRTDVPSC
jgi:PDZ domain-containing protein